MRRAALFDLDRTLVRVETASLYVRYQREIGEATLTDLLRTLAWVAEYTLGVLDAERVAARVAATLAGTREVAMVERCERWVERDVMPHVGAAARAAVERHLAAGDLLAIVTGATPYASRPVARRLGIPHVLASELEVDGGAFTGRFVQPLCYGRGKITRVERLARERGFSLADAIFYTDSYTDLPLLCAVGEPVVVNPDPRLAREARRRGWRVERW